MAYSFFANWASLGKLELLLLKLLLDWIISTFERGIFFVFICLFIFYLIAASSPYLSISSLFLSFSPPSPLTASSSLPLLQTPEVLSRWERSEKAPKEGAGSLRERPCVAARVASTRGRKETSQRRFGAALHSAASWRISSSLHEAAACMKHQIA